MDTIQHIIWDTTLARIGDSEFADYLCHAYCYQGHCTFERHNRQFRMEAGDCLIVPRRGDMRGHLALFENPIMRLKPEQQKVCQLNFETIKRRLSETTHRFRHDALRNAVECMIIDFFDFHAELYGADKISSQQHQLMEQFIEMLERGDYRRNRDISYYADQLCVTTKYLSEVCKKVSGLPAAYWITRYASLDISRLLRDRSLSFTDIIDLFGFSSPAHFSRYVQTNLGAKPSELRE